MTDDEVFVPGRTMSLLRNRAFSFGPRLWEEIGSPERVTLVASRNGLVLGMRAATAEDETTYKVTRNWGSCIVGVGALLTAYDVDTSESRRYPAHVKEGILYVELDGPSKIVTMRRRTA